MRARALALLILAAPAFAVAARAPARPHTTPPPVPTAPAPAAAGPAAAASATPQPARWLLVEGTPELTGGIGLEWRVTPPGGTEQRVGMIACVKPSGVYFAAPGFKRRPGIATLDLQVDGRAFPLPLLPRELTPGVLEAVGPTPAGMLDALGFGHAVRLVHGDQATPLVTAPDPQVTTAFASVCAKLEAAHG
ncbi:MAG TPA: hypothetical protein VG939_05600 [Caulobacteraceae bacterium]|nr:hypothetical protein [Caulobacteraceae bacterium]